MKRIASLVALGVSCTITTIAMAADHFDSPSVMEDSSPTLADLGGLFVWMDAENDQMLNIVQTTYSYVKPPSALRPEPRDQVFGTALQYIVHISSMSAYGKDQGSKDSAILCQFFEVDGIECWVGDEYVVGDPYTPEGIVSESGKLRVFAGLRNDPFLIDIPAFAATVGYVTPQLEALRAQGDPSADSAPGCPDVESAQADDWMAVFRGEKLEKPNTTPLEDTFEGTPILALAIQIDKSVVDGGGPILAVWSSANAVPVGGGR